MRVTLLGHASVLVEIHGRTVLIDPVFADPFGEGALVSCPARRIDVDRLPKIDVLILSHAHPDHLDLPTLAKLPRECVVLCPKDETILYVLEKLGFKGVRPTDADTVVKFGHNFEVLTTPSVRSVIEFGVVLKDDTGTFFHQLDTQLTPQIVEHVRTRVGRIHLLFAAYAVQGFAYFGSQRPGYPAQELQQSVACARQIAPALVVPASAGFRFTEPFAWTNAFLFPISRERFLADLARAAPNLPSAIGNPGDVFEIAKGAVKRHPGASRVATMLEDDTHLIDYEPTAHVPALADPNCDGYPLDLIARQVEDTMNEIAEFVRAGYAKKDPLVEEHRRTRAVYGLGVVFPDGRERFLRIHFDATEPKITQADGLIRGALITHRIAASVLTARARYEKSYHYTGGLSRLTVISPATLADGKVVIDAREPPDLLIYHLKLKPPGLEHHERQTLDFRLAPFLVGFPR